MRRSVKTFAFILLLLMGTMFHYAALLGIQKTEWKGKIEYENGIQVIKNPMEPLYGEITFELEEDLLIEDKDGIDFFFEWPCDLNVDSNGNIYVCDQRQHKVYIFDKLGNYLKVLGGEGQGPGEFNTPRRIVIDDEDRINVIATRKLHLFDDKAKFIKSINLSFARSCNLTENGNILAHLDEMGPTGLAQRIYLLNPEGKKTKKIDEQLISMENMKNPHPDTGFGPMFHLAPLDYKSSIYGCTDEYRLYVIDSSGGVVQVIERDESQKRAHYFYGLFTTDIGFILTDRRMEKEKGEPNPFDIFNSKGHYIFKAFINGISRPVLRAGYLYTLIYESETSAFFVKRYKIKNWDQIKKGI